MLKINSLFLIIINILYFSCNKIDSPDDSKLISYTFKAVVNSDFDMTFGEFKAVFGDTLTGSISYLLNSPDNNDGDINQGWYYDLPAPAHFSFTLNNLQYRSNSMLIIGIQNNDTQAFHKGDMFEISSHDTAAANRFHADDVQEILKLQDTTSNVFTNDSLPPSINLDNFSSKWLFVNFVKKDTAYDVRLRIINFLKAK